ncbi:MAG: CDP-diacylglycerol--glycerol-3-phosphate 3-phosphatidyltransferase, partial [Gammaproteobacteria bacterium]|nr:CDP-diacylglycerol--glycerol-3-phosphate 3-phosphatidyltransferase [Gammaproteobacteria bacterium]
YLCALIFIAAMLTDWLDGYLARRFGQQSAFGAFFDPVADKLVIATALILIVGREQSLVITLPALVIVGREITVSALREWMAEIGKRALIAVSFIAKLKTVAQAVAIGALLWHYPILGVDIHQIGVILLYFAALLTLISMFDYLKIAWRSISGK